ncbi:MAG: integrase [Nitrospiraceae bacterium]
MAESEKLSLEQIRALLEGTEEVQFQARDRAERYGWVERVLRQQDYPRLGRVGKGLVRRYLAKMTGLSRAQLTRLIGRYEQGQPVAPPPPRRHRFATRYTKEDILLLAEVDRAHQSLSGPATQKILQRAWHTFGDRRFQRLATLSVAQLYRLRQRPAYRQQRVVYQPTRPTAVAIGERRKPEPRGRPGFLRVDTVHQGDQDGVKGLYHINAVDEVTQWQVVGATPHISETWLLPVLQAMLDQFPFRIHGFHSDNGSEFINHTVSRLLQKLLIEQTKSRPRHSNDNGLAESKNGWVIRKHIGWGHIGAAHAEAFDQFYRQHFNPYLNFHRPCGVPEIRVTAKGKQKRVYRWYATPWEILRQVPDLARHLKADLTVAELDQQARQCSDTEAAQLMQQAKQTLLAGLRGKKSA